MSIDPETFDPQTGSTVEAVAVAQLAKDNQLIKLLGRCGNYEAPREIFSGEIQRRLLHKIYRSSESVKHLTSWLIGLTIVLCVLAVPPFCEFVSKTFYPWLHLMFQRFSR